MCWNYNHVPGIYPSLNLSFERTMTKHGEGGRDVELLNTHRKLMFTPGKDICTVVCLPDNVIDFNSPVSIGEISAFLDNEYQIIRWNHILTYELDCL